MYQMYITYNNMSSKYDEAEISSKTVSFPRRTSNKYEM